MAGAEPFPEPAAATAQTETGATLTVDLAAVEANWHALARRLLTGECGAVVKANAYGLGLEPITTRLVAAGCKTFFVADLAEARRVRACARDATIYALNGFVAEGSAAFPELNVRPVINSMTELAEWEAFAASQDWHGGAALHVDTGMSRLGISVEEAAGLAVRVQRGTHAIALLMSHFACADIADHPLNASQIRLFREVCLLYSGIAASLANSSGIFLGDSAHCDLARPGAALYGINPTPGRPNPMRSVVEMSGRILQIRSVGRGETVGYGATWTAKRVSRIAVVALGYADGLLRAASGADREHSGGAIVHGKFCRFAGRISMDLACIDVTDLGEGTVRRGDVATLIDGTITVDDVAASAGTIGYEILTRLGARCHPTYRNA